MALARTTNLALASLLTAACATPEVPGTYERTGERQVRVTLNPGGSAVVASSIPGRPSAWLVQGTWAQGEGGVVIVTLTGQQIIFLHAGDELVAKDWDRGTWGAAGPGVLKRKEP